MCEAACLGKTQPGTPGLRRAGTEGRFHQQEWDVFKPEGERKAGGEAEQETGEMSEDWRRIQVSSPSCGQKPWQVLKQRGRFTTMDFLV